MPETELNCPHCHGNEFSWVEEIVITGSVVDNDGWRRLAADGRSGAEVTGVQFDSLHCEGCHSSVDTADLVEEQQSLSEETT